MKAIKMTEKELDASGWVKLYNLDLINEVWKRENMRLIWDASEEEIIEVRVIFTSSTSQKGARK